MVQNNSIGFNLVFLSRAVVIFVDVLDVSHLRHPWEPAPDEHPRNHAPSVSTVAKESSVVKLAIRLHQPIPSQNRYLALPEPQFHSLSFYSLREHLTDSIDIHLLRTP